jgi:hypothetical protein
MATLVSQGPIRIKHGAVEGMVDNPVIGAVNRILPHPTNPNIMYIGSVNGGVWRTTNAKSSDPTWTPLTDNLYSTSIGALAFDTNDTSYNTIIAGIGRTSALAQRGGALSGLQILKTTDNGTTFTQTQVGVSSNEIGRLRGLNITGVVAGELVVVRVLETNPVTGAETYRDKTTDIPGILVSVDKADNANYDNYGVFRSTDNGVTFTRVTGIPNGRAADMVVDPTNPSTIYVAIYNLESKSVSAVTSGYGGTGGWGGVYRSTNWTHKENATWSKVSDTAIDDAIRQHTKNIKLAVSKNGRVYVAISVGASSASKGELRAIFRSQDSGNSWNALSLPTTTENGVQYGIHPGGQGFVHFSFEADPINPDIIYIGGDRQPSSFGGTNRNIMPSRYYTPGASDTPNTDATFPNSIGAETYSGRLFRGVVNPSTNTCAWVHLTHSQFIYNESSIQLFDASGNPQLRKFIYNDGIQLFDASGNPILRFPTDPEPDFPAPEGAGGTANNSAPHADSRDMAFDASGNLIECDDGGIYRRTSPQTNTGDWFSMNGNLQVTEIHSIVYDPATKLITAGTQDNGTIQLVNPYSSAEPKIWNKISPGDGAVVCVDTLHTPSSSSTPSSLLYFSSQNLLGFKRVEASGNSYNFPGQSVGLTSSTFSPQFYTPIKANSVVGGRLLLAGADSLYESFDKGDTLTKIGTGSMTFCSCIAYGGKKDTTLRPDLVYACKNNLVFLRRPGSSPSSFVSINPFPSNHTYSKIIDISVDPRDWERAFIVSVSPKSLSSGRMSSVHMTANAGRTWIDITGSLATSNIGEIYTCDLIRNPAHNFGGLVVGTEAGVWVLKRTDVIDDITIITKDTTRINVPELSGVTKYSITDGSIILSTKGYIRYIDGVTTYTTSNPPPPLNPPLPLTDEWTKITWIKEGGEQIPNAQITDIDYNPTDDILVVGTLGRGAWSITGLNTIYPPPPPPTSGSGSVFPGDPEPEPEPEVPIPVYPNRISSMVLRVTQGTNIYEEPIILPSESATSLGTKSINISNTTLINAINNSESGTIFCPEIITTYDTGTYTVRAYGSPFVTP